MRLSVLIPTRDEARALPLLMADLQRWPGELEQPMHARAASLVTDMIDCNAVHDSQDRYIVEAGGGDADVDTPILRCLEQAGLVQGVPIVGIAALGGGTQLDGN